MDKPAPDITATLAERGARYGTFTEHAFVAQNLKDFMRDAPVSEGRGWRGLANDQKQALEVIADKIARILAGDPNYHDNWHDIQGYAKLVADRLQRAGALGQVAEHTAPVSAPWPGPLPPPKDEAERIARDRRFNEAVPKTAAPGDDAAADDRVAREVIRRKVLNAEIAALKAQVASEYEARQMAEEIVDDYKTRLGEVLTERDQAHAERDALADALWCAEDQWGDDYLWQKWGLSKSLTAERKQALIEQRPSAGGEGAP